MPAVPGIADDLTALIGNIESCKICRLEPSGVVLPHEPRPVVRVSQTARVVIAGQAPGVRVHNTGIPFNDPSGDRLRDWMKISRDVFYDQSRLAIVPMGFCFPGHDKHKGDLPPRPECAKTWHDTLFEALPQIKVVLAIGAHAHAYHLKRLDRLGKSTAKNKSVRSKSVLSMTETVSNWRFYLDGDPKVFVLPHPSWRNNAWLKKHPWFETETLPAMRAELAIWL